MKRTSTCTLYGYAAYLVRGYVAYLTSEHSDCTLYPYEVSKYGGYDNVSGYYTPAQLRDRIRRDRVIIR